MYVRACVRACVLACVCVWRGNSPPALQYIRLSDEFWMNNYNFNEVLIYQRVWMYFSISTSFFRVNFSEARCSKYFVILIIHMLYWGILVYEQHHGTKA